MAVTISGGQEPRRKPKKGNAAFLAVILALLAASAGFLYFGVRDYRSMRNMVLTWTEIQDLAHDEEDGGEAVQGEFVEADYDSEGEVTVSTVQGEVQPAGDWLYRAIDMDALKAINPDVDGYIYIPGTNVDYPILKEPQLTSSYYYINHNMYKESDKYGSIFELSDEERRTSEIDNPITWIFGHHMASGSMFATLYNYEDQAFYDNPIYIYRDEWRAEYQAVGYCIVNETSAIYAFDSYERGSDDYGQLLEWLKENNKMQAQREWFDKNDDLTVLSTCYGGSGTEWRMVLLCREVRRAMTPEFYENKWEVDQYGGSGEAEFVPDETQAPSMGIDTLGE